MSDFKSKLPDLNEIGAIAGKFYKDVKKSVIEIIDDFKKNRPVETKTPTKKPAAKKAAEKK